MPAWIGEFAREHGDLFYALAVFSGVTFVVSLFAVPWLLARIPADYFVRDRPHRDHDRRWIVWLLRKIAKNLIGLVLFLAGLAMIGLPGQGLLTMFIGLSLVDFPGKRKLELRLIARPHVRRAINWLRARHGKPPLIVDGDPHAPGSGVIPVPSQCPVPDAAAHAPTESSGCAQN
jgi:hypothetical protein